MEPDEVKKCSHTCIYSEASLTCLHRYSHNLPDAECDENPDHGFCGSHECAILLQLDTLKLQLEESKEDEAKLIALNNSFRTLMLGPANMEKLVKDGAVDLSTYNRYLERKDDAGWEKTSSETLAVFVAVHQRQANYLAEKLGRRITKLEIKKELIKKSASESKAAKRVIEDEQKNAEEKTFYATAFGKAVAGTMKTFKVDRTTAEQMVRSMGIK